MVNLDELKYYLASDGGTIADDKIDATIVANSDHNKAAVTNNTVKNILNSKKKKEYRVNSIVSKFIADGILYRLSADRQRQVMTFIKSAAYSVDSGSMTYKEAFNYLRKLR